LILRNKKNTCAQSHTHCQVAQKPTAKAKTCQRVCLLPTSCRPKENNEMVTMAKKHKGFGGELEAQSFD
jgi:hypothetical protein